MDALSNPNLNIDKALKNIRANKRVSVAFNYETLVTPKGEVINQDLISLIKRLKSKDVFFCCYFINGNIPTIEKTLSRLDIQADMIKSTIPFNFNFYLDSSFGLKQIYGELLTFLHLYDKINKNTG